MKPNGWTYLSNKKSHPIRSSFIRKTSPSHETSHGCHIGRGFRPAIGTLGPCPGGVYGEPEQLSDSSWAKFETYSTRLFGMVDVVFWWHLVYLVHYQWISILRVKQITVVESFWQNILNRCYQTVAKWVVLTTSTLVSRCNAVPLRCGADGLLVQWFGWVHPSDVENCKLVGGLEHFYFPIYIGHNHPNWLMFFRGVQTTNQ